MSGQLCLETGSGLRAEPSEEGKERGWDEQCGTLPDWKQQVSGDGTRAQAGFQGALRLAGMRKGSG